MMNYPPTLLYRMMPHSTYMMPQVNWKNEIYCNGFNLRREKAKQIFGHPVREMLDDKRIKIHGV